MCNEIAKIEMRAEKAKNYTTHLAVARVQSNENYIVSRVAHLSPKTIVAEKTALHIAAQMVDQTVVPVHVEKHKLPGDREKAMKK